MACSSFRQYGFKEKVSKTHRDCGKSTAAKQNQAGTVVFKKHPLLLVKSCKPLKININTENKKLFIQKYRDCGKTTTAQNQAGIVVFKKQTLVTICDELSNSKNHVKN